MRSLSAVLAVFIAIGADAATFIVSNTSDLGPGSLRQAIGDANANPGLDIIDFSIGTGAQTIVVASPLIVTSPLIIDGSTQEGFSGTPLIVLHGNATGNGLELAAGANGSVIRKLVFANFLGATNTAAIGITGANGVTVAGNYLGSVVDFYLRNGGGIRIHTADNTIGGLTAADRNVSVNASFEIQLMATATRNVIQGNYLGFDPTGLIARVPSPNGVTINGGSDNVIGGTVAGARNVIITSSHCIRIASGGRNNRIEGNYLGLNADGLAAAPYLPGTVGVLLTDTDGGNVVGGTVAAARNVISNNHQGVDISSEFAVDDRVQGNFIGTDPTGLFAIPNSIGVILGANSAIIGGTGPGEGNLISGNGQYGVCGIL